MVYEFLFASSHFFSEFNSERIVKNWPRFAEDISKIKMVYFFCVTV